MKAILIFLILFISSQVFGQSFQNETIVQDYINKLTNQGVDTILVYEMVCSNCPPTVLKVKDSCYSMQGIPQVSYIFWRKTGKDHATKVGNFSCSYNTINYDMEAFWILGFSNLSKIKKEIKKFKKDTSSMNYGQYLSFHIRFSNHAVGADFEILKNLYDFENINCDSNSVSNKLSILIGNETRNIENNRLIKSLKEADVQLK
jgi:hypothetical protein